MSYPEKLGQPCWKPAQVRKVISLTAQTSAESAPYFLAAHSPFQRITDGKSSGRTLTEEGVFQEIFSANRAEVQAFVRGEPGTGKSHLIRWLKLRADYAKQRRESGLENCTFILVSRGNGSLKDALGQIVQQLGGDFERHIVRVRGAIEKLSDAAARDMLLLALALELDTHWNNRHSTPLPSPLRHLGQALRANGFGRWFKRDGGVIHQVIQRLTETSTIAQRETNPEFTAADFEVPLTYLRPDENPGQVINFSEDLAEEPETRELAAQKLNAALKHAVHELTGLKGEDLLKIFTDIRRQLGPKKSLAVFIEDVSVTGLDQDVINAFEPRSDNELCRMVVVLGVTETGWSRMAPNQRQRATLEFEVGGQAAEQWVSSTDNVAAFAARYLNAVRMKDEDIASVAEQRFNGEIQHSHCTACPRQESCFATFGKVDLGDNVSIGTFPFTPHAPRALLGRLNDAFYKSQRGLLDRVLLPALDQSYRSLESREFPQPALFSVQSPPFTTWTGFTNRYCGGAQWDEQKKARLRFIAQFWDGSTDTDALAKQLEPLLEPLGFPKFSAATPTTRARDARTQSQNTKQDIVTPPPPPPEDRVLNATLGFLDTWSNGGTLQQDNKFRDVLWPFLRASIRWRDQRGTPISEVKERIKGNKFPRIEGQTTSQPNQQHYVEFDRSNETRDLLEALLLFEHRGNKSWNFEHGELHKRNVSRWLRKHRKRVVESLQPIPDSLPSVALRTAVQALAIAALIRDRRQLPADRVERLEALFTPIWNPAEKPSTLSSELQSLISDLEQKYTGLQALVVQEVGAGQGEANPDDFLDPVPILKVLDGFETQPQVQPPPPEIEQNFWKARFQSVSKLGSYSKLPEWLAKEREAIARATASVRRILQEAGIEEEEPRKDLAAFFEQALEVIALQQGSQRARAILPIPDEPFDQLWKMKVLQDSNRRETWGVALANASALASETFEVPLLTFDPRRFQELTTCLRTLENHFDLVDKHLRDEEEAGGPSGDSREHLLQVLGEIASGPQVSGTSTDSDE